MTSWHHRTRAAAALVLAGLLGGCSSDGNNWIEMFKVARNLWDTRDAPVGLDEAAAIPYATLGVRVNGGREQILVLATDNHGERLWTASALVAITTREGRIVRTAGFGTDLSGYGNGVGSAGDWNQPHRYSWSADFADLGLYSVLVQCQVTPAGPDPVTILGKEINTFRVDETCRADRIDWSFTNSYWISSETGRIWRSIQAVHPKGLVLEIEILRPPLSAGAN